jgi:hypothetical protein
VDNNKQQQLNYWSEGHEAGTKMTAVTFRAEAMALIPSILPHPGWQILLPARFRLVIALVPKVTSGVDVMRAYMPGGCIKNNRVYQES